MSSRSPLASDVAGSAAAVGYRLGGGDEAGTLALGLSFARHPIAPRARRLFAGSVLYLPRWLLLAALDAA